MFLETGRIIAVEADCLWVETIQRSACGSCQAQKGCGHSALAKWGASASRLKVFLDGRDSSQFRVGDQVQIGVPEEVIATGSLFIYCVPLLMMLVASVVAHHQQLGDGWSALSALAGLIVGAVIVRWRSHQLRFDTRVQPMLIDEQTRVQAIQTVIWSKAMLIINSHVHIPLHEIELTAMRAQGAGGQNVNKVSSAIHLRFDIHKSSLSDFCKSRLLALDDKRISSDGVLIIKAQRHRTQEMNRADALERLREIVVNAIKIVKDRRATKPTFSSKQKRMDGKTIRSTIKSARARVIVD